MNEVSPVVTAEPPMAEPVFIPVSRTDIIDALLNPELWPSDAQHNLAASVLGKIGLLRQHKSAEMLNQLSDIYDPFNPDDETINLTETSGMERLEKRRMLNAKLRELVSSANYHEMQANELSDILTRASPDGVQVDVDFKEYEVKLIFYRGETQLSQSKRDVRMLYLRRRNLVIPTFERLFLAIKFKPEAQRIEEIMREDQVDEEKARKKLRRLRRSLPPTCSTDHIYLKIFKDIPRYDVEMLFPNIRVKMKYSDKLQIGGSAVVGTVTWAFGTATKLLVTAALSPMVLAGALATGVGGIMYAQIRNVFITRDRYRMLLAQRLYFQNLANNQGAMALMVDEAEEEDVKEEALLYIHLLLSPVHISQLDHLRNRIDVFLKQKFDIDVNFDVRDALTRLIANGLVVQSPGGDLRATGLEEANQQLRDRWCRIVEQR